VVSVSRSSQRWRDQNNDVTADEEHFNGSLGSLAKGTDTRRDNTDEEQRQDWTKTTTKLELMIRQETDKTNYKIYPHNFFIGLFVNFSSGHLTGSELEYGLR
jgi:hypothetical protein